MHSKTLLKVNVAALVALAGGLFVGVHSYMAWPAVHYSDFPKGLSEARFALRLLFSLLSLFWNSLVCVILVSVARTHTIGERLACSCSMCHTSRSFHKLHHIMGMWSTSASLAWFYAQCFLL